MANLSARDETWLAQALEGVRHVGYAVIEDVLPPDFVKRTVAAMYAAQAAIVADVGPERLQRAGEVGVLRLMIRYQPHFYGFLELPELLQVVDSTVGNTAVMHLQNGFILPSFATSDQPQVFQNKFHMDFPRVLNGYLASINVFFAVDAFTAENGGTLVVPGTHQRATAPDRAYLDANTLAVECPPGSMLVFDSTLWHAAGQNVSGKDRLALNHQFTRSYFKQQLDYVRALGDEAILARPPRTQQLLGWYTRLPTSLDDYYQPPDKRFYRGGQG